MMPIKMKAAVLTELKKPLVVTEVTLPKELAVGQVLVKVRYSGICGSQLGEIDGVKGADPYIPHLLGHEGSGEVVECGPGVKHVAPGDHVVLHWRKGNGIEAATPVYEWNGKSLNAGPITTFNEFAVVSENRVTKIDAATDMHIAALFGCAVTTGFGVIENSAQIRIGESIMVFGSGGVGLIAIKAAALSSAFPIIAVDRFENRLELAKSFGATHTIDSSRDDPVSALRSIVGAAGLDCFVDTTGRPEIIELGIELTNADGRVVLVGVPPKQEKVSFNTLCLHFGKTISGSTGGGAIPATDIIRLERLVKNGRLELGQFISAVRPLAEVNEAISDMRLGKISGRCLIEMGA